MIRTLSLATLLALASAVAWADPAALINQSTTGVLCVQAPSAVAGSTVTTGPCNPIGVNGVLGFQLSQTNGMNFLTQSGADPTGTAQQASAINGALGVAKGAGQGLYLPFGTFNLTAGNATLPVDVPLEFGNGVTFNTAGHYIAHTGDFSTFIGQQINHAWMRSTDHTGNDWGIYSGLHVEPTTSAMNYEKGAAYFFADTSDASSYTSLGDAATVWKDAVGFQTTGQINDGNVKGRAWGGTSNCVVITAAANGECVGFEVDVTDNSGVSQPLLDTPTTKIGVSSITLGTTNPTSAFLVGSFGSSQWHIGVDIKGSAVSDYAFALRDVTTPTLFTASIDAAGNIIGKKVTAGNGLFATSITNYGTIITALGTPASSSASCTAGQFEDDANYHYVCVATNTWKRVALSSF